MGKNGYQDLGLGEDVGPMQMSELSIEAQSQEAFRRIGNDVPENLRGRFVNLAIAAAKKAAVSSDEQVDVDSLVERFERILRDLMDGGDGKV
jgi:methionine synthase I (cobalamin-dependent)